MKKQLPAWAALCIIALAAGLLLALTNALTETRIEEQTLLAADAARKSVLQAATDFEQLKIAEDSGIDNCYVGSANGEAVGHTAQVTTKGYGGAIEVIVGLDMDGVISGISVGGANFSETAGLGAKSKDPAFTEQFQGITPPVVLKENVDAITAATITSNAVVGAVNKAVDFIKADIRGESQIAIDDSWEDENGNTVIVTSEQGYGGPVEVQTTFDADNAIVSVLVGGEAFAETPDFGGRILGNAEFADQFIGKSEQLTYGEGVDALTGATVTSEAALKAINTAIAYQNGETLPSEPVVERLEAATVEEATAQGFGGPVDVTVGITADGAVAYVDIVAASETDNIGSKVVDSAFTDQFIGKTGPFEFGNGVDSVTGATVSSNAALEAINGVFGVSVAPATEAPATEAPTAEGNSLEGSSYGYGGDVVAKVTLDDSGNIAALEIVAAGETAGLGARVATSEFIDQFIGKAGPFEFGSGVDALSGATISSDAALAAINKALEGAEAPETEEPIFFWSGATQGFGGPISVKIGVSMDGKVSSLVIDASMETEGVGTKVMNAEFTDQFIGKTGPFELGTTVDALSGATLSSTAALNAINAAYAPIAAIQGIPAQSGAGGIQWWETDAGRVVRVEHEGETVLVCIAEDGAVRNIGVSDEAALDALQPLIGEPAPAWVAQSIEGGM